MGIKARVWLLPLLFTLLLSFFARETFSAHVDAAYPPDWEMAAWIAPPGPAAVAYYRKELVLADAPSEAHLQIAAPDVFQVYVNGALLGSKIMLSASASTIIDIGPSLIAGRNVIAIKIDKKTQVDEPALIVSGDWRDKAGRLHRIVSDGSWQVSTKEEWQYTEPRVAGEAAARPAGIGAAPDGFNSLATASWSYWYASDFIARQWAQAVVRTDINANRPMQPLKVPPRVFHDFPRGQWIWSADRLSAKATLEREFEVPDASIHEAWLGVASPAGAYTLSVNGHFLLRSKASNAYMDTYDVAPYLRGGGNSIVLNATAPSPGALVAIALSVESAGMWRDFSSDGRWLSRASDPKALREPVAIAGEMGRLPVEADGLKGNATRILYPTLRLLEVPTPAAWWWQRVTDWLVWFMAILAINLGLTWLLSMFWRRRNGDSIWIERPWLHPSAAGSAVLVFLFLLQYDVRLVPAGIFSPPLFWLIWAAVLVWVAIGFGRSRAGEADSMQEVAP